MGAGPVPAPDCPNDPVVDKGQCPGPLLHQSRDGTAGQELGGGAEGFLSAV